MAHVCSIIPKVYIDKVFLGDATLSTSDDGEITVNTGDIMVNLKFEELIEASIEESPWSAFRTMEFPNSDIDIQNYVKIVCMLSTSQEVTDIKGLIPKIDMRVAGQPPGRSINITCTDQPLGMAALIGPHLLVTIRNCTKVGCEQDSLTVTPSVANITQKSIPSMSLHAPQTSPIKMSRLLPMEYIGLGLALSATMRTSSRLPT
jgi:hypothetical protein